MFQTITTNKTRPALSNTMKGGEKMSVILFTKSEVFQTMADSYEGLKQYMRGHYSTFTEEYDSQFYMALRRLYFANVACFLCQYHDDTPLGVDELSAIETFAEDMTGKPELGLTPLQQASKFLQAWGSLKYNLVTNAGEWFIAQKSFDFINDLAVRYSYALITDMAENEEQATGRS